MLWFVKWKRSQQCTTRANCTLGGRFERGRKGVYNKEMANTVPKDVEYLSRRQRAAIRLRVWGCSVAEVSDLTGYSQHRVSQIVNSPAGRTYSVEVARSTAPEYPRARRRGALQSLTAMCPLCKRTLKSAKKGPRKPTQSAPSPPLEPDLPPDSEPS